MHHYNGFGTGLDKNIGFLGEKFLFRFLGFLGFL